MCTDCEAIISEHKRQMYRLRVCLIMERAGKPTANLSIRALKYIADSYRLRMDVSSCAKYLGAFEEVWKNENHSVQPA